MFTDCPRCYYPLKKATAWNESESEFWYECTNPKCNTFVNSYQPQAHQSKFHRDEHTFIGNFGGYGSGKAQPTNTPIPTPDGWRTLGDIQPGDFVFDQFGQPTKVVSIHPQGEKPVYKVSLRGGASTRCCEDHLWTWYDSDHARWHTKPLKYMLRFGVRNSKNHYRYTIPLPDPVEYPEAILKTPPYVLGILLGDGCLREKCLTISSGDEEIIQECGRLLMLPFKKRSAYNFHWDFAAKPEDIVPTALVDTYSHEKFIPEEYLTASVDQRFALLQGLIDSDGSVFKRSAEEEAVRFQYSTNSTKLKDGITELVRSLGMYCNSYYLPDRGYYDLRIAVPEHLRDKVFRLSRKKEIATSYTTQKTIRQLSITGIEEDGIEECVCIKVENPDGLYLTEDYIVTHNTLTSRQELYKHCFLTPNGNALIGANVISQYEQTIKREIESDLPKQFIKRVHPQKNYMDLINGYRIMYRPFDDPDKLRSYNLDFFLIMEGSEVKRASYTQLKARLRNMSAATPLLDKDGNQVTKIVKDVRVPVYDHKWHRGIIESNPDSGWIKSEVLEVSDEYHINGDIMDKITVDPDLADKSTSSHITATSCNAYLPEGFIERNAKNKPLWWIRRYLHGSFSYAEGLVYPQATDVVIPAYSVDIKRDWKRLAAFDYGLVDPSVFIFGAIDPIENLLHIYKEIWATETNIEVLASLFKEATKDIPVGGWAGTPIIDPKSGPKRDYNKKSLTDHFMDYGISFKSGYPDVAARVYRLNTYINTGRVVIHDNCVKLIKELKEYKYITDESKMSGYKNMPEDKNNHGINALEWIVMDLTADPHNMTSGVYGRDGKKIATIKGTPIEEIDPGHFALMDKDDFKKPDITLFEW